MSYIVLVVVAQSVRALPCGGRGCQFDSGQPPQERIFAHLKIVSKGFWASIRTFLPSRVRFENTNFKSCLLSS